MTQLVALPDGTELAGDYKILRVLGAGGFGVTYLAEEKALSRYVSIKEYFPVDFATRNKNFAASPRSHNCKDDYSWGLDRFIEEAQTLARFDHPHIVRVYRVFRAHGTAYMVLHFEEGQSFKSWLSSLGRAPRQKELDLIVPGLLDALQTIHAADFLHRDIAPDNIIIRKSGEPVLIDFGAARGELAAHSKTKTVSALVKPGYSPYEQYAESSRQQGPWTDIYALAATLYHAVCGKRPLDSPSRMLTDELTPARDAALASYRATFLNAIDHGLAITTDSRPQSIAAWRGALLAPEPAKPGIFQRLTGNTERVGGNKKQSSASEAEQTNTTGAATPPPPDAPGPRGGILDFVEGLSPKAVTPTPAKDESDVKPDGKAKANAKATKQDNAKKPARGGLARRLAEQKKAAPTPPPAKAKPGKNADQAAAAAHRTRVKPQPDVKPKRGRFRRFMIKTALAASVAGLIFVYKDEIPRVVAQQSEVAFSRLTTGALPPPKKRNNEVTEQSSFVAHEGGIEDIGLSGDGRLLVTMSDDARLKVWSTESQSLVGTIHLEDGPAKAFSIRNYRITTAHADGSVAVYDLESRKRVSHFKRNEATIWQTDFVDSQDVVAAASHDWSVTLWTTGQQQEPATILRGHKSAVQSLAVDPRGRWIASGSADKTVKLWSVESGRTRRTLRSHSDYVSSLAFSPNGRSLAAGSLDGTVKLWSATTGRARRTLRAHKARVTSLAFSPNGMILASAAEDGSVHLRGLGRQRLYRSLDGLATGAKTLTFTNDGLTLITGGRDGKVRFWSMPQPAIAQRG